jgi:membrane associated rhomboid family serine protease
MFFVLPLKVDVPTWRRPFVKYALIAACLCMFLIAPPPEDPVANPDSRFMKLAGIEIVRQDDEDTFLPTYTSRLTTKDFPLPILSLNSAFLHVGWLHLIGNMFFLWVFGTAVNYKFGQLGFIAVYLAAAVGCGMTHYLADGSPAVGASGAINGVMAAFLVFFPRNDVTAFYFVFIPPLVLAGPRVGRIASAWLILFWIAWDVIWLVSGLEFSVAFWGHIGGFLTGLAIALLCAATGWIKPTRDEQTLLQVLGVRK